LNLKTASNDFDVEIKYGSYFSLWCPASEIQSLRYKTVQPFTTGLSLIANPDIQGSGFLNGARSPAVSQSNSVDLPVQTPLLYYLILIQSCLDVFREFSYNNGA
jgi:hypothetical protein